MGLRAYLTGGALAIVLALVGANVWLVRSRAALIEQRAELQRQVEIGAALLEQAQAAQAIADTAARKEVARARAAEMQIRRILAADQQTAIEGGEGHEANDTNDCGGDPIGCALDWLRRQ